MHERILVFTTDFECAFPPLRCYKFSQKLLKLFSSQSILNFFSCLLRFLLETPWDAGTTWRFSRKTLAATAAARPSNQNKSSRGMDWVHEMIQEKHERTVSFLCCLLSGDVIGSCSTFRRREMKIIALRKWKTTKTDKSFMAKHISTPRSIIGGERGK